MLPISVCMIAKNEEKYLETCLQKLCRYNWEIVITDTGSTDATIEIARKYTDKVYHFPWKNDFSAARNFCVSKASNDWILSVDCDEYLCNEESEKALFTLLQSCFQNPASVGLVRIRNPFATGAGESATIEPIGRFFHRHYYTYVGSIHEQPLPLDNGLASYQNTPFLFHHEGYSDPVILRTKAMRNASLLEESLSSNPDDPYLYYQLGQSYFVMEDYEKACSVFQKGLTFDVDPSQQYVRTMVESYGHCLLNLKKYQEALSFEGIYDAFSSHADFVFLMGLIYMNNGLFEEAITQFLKATRIPDHSVQGINSYLAHYNAGVIRECMGNLQEARSFYQKCGSYGPALEALKRVKG